MLTFFFFGFSKIIGEKEKKFICLNFLISLSLLSHYCFSAENFEEKNEEIKIFVTVR
jgi:hypothetical protein